MDARSAPVIGLLVAKQIKMFINEGESSECTWELGVTRGDKFRNWVLLPFLSSSCRSQTDRLARIPRIRTSLKTRQPSPT